jgi:hypothetical protein
MALGLIKVSFLLARRFTFVVETAGILSKYSRAYLFSQILLLMSKWAVMRVLMRKQVIGRGSYIAASHESTTCTHPKSVVIIEAPDSS